MSEPSIERSALARVADLAESWVGFDDSHHYGDAVLAAIDPEVMCVIPPPMNWYDDRAKLALLARYMGEQGDTVEDVAYMLEKPWKFEDEWRRSILRPLASDA